MTSSHVVEDSQSISVRFGLRDIKAVIEQSNTLSDCAVLKLSQPISAPTLRKMKQVSHGSNWISFGYPLIAQGKGVLIEGVIRNPSATDPRGGPAIQLFSPDAAAGRGAHLQGFSGAPVLVNGLVVGHLNWTMPDETGAAEMGTVYACPIEYVEALLPAETVTKHIDPQPPGAAFDPLWYIHRDLPERVLLNCLALAGSPAVVWGPELMGKTTLIKWALHHVRQEDLQQGAREQVLEVNLETLPKEALTSLDKLLYHFSSRMLAAAPSAPSWLDEMRRRPGDPLERADWLLRERLLPAKDGKLVLTIESADALHSCDYQDEFFSLLRAWTQDADNEQLSKLRLILAISTTPTLLSNKITQSPFFTAATIVRLEDFTRVELVRLAELYGLEAADEDIHVLASLVGGHPYLVRLVMFAAAISGKSITDVLNDDQDTVFGPFVFRLQERLRQQPEMLAALFGLLDRSQTRLQSNVAYQLGNAGLIRRDGGAYVIRYRLYEQFLAKMK